MGVNVYPGQRMVKLPALRRIRLWRGLTQVELSGLTGLQQSTISRLEQGGEAELRTMRRLARALSVSHYDLMGERPDVPPTQEPEGGQ